MVSLRARYLRGLLAAGLLSFAIATATGAERVPVLLVLEPEPFVIQNVREEAGRSLDLGTSHELAIRAAQDHANVTQANLLKRLAELEEAGQVSDIRSFWVANAIALKCEPELLPVLERLPEVVEIQDEQLLGLLPIAPPVAEGHRNPLDDGVTVALTDIRAPEAWALGLTGVGVLLANFDSGVLGTHPALSSRWRGNNGHPANHCWFDLVEPITPTPGDNDGHGTLTMGLQCGLGASDTVGVAFNAQFIAAAVAEGGFTITNALQAFEWILDPDGNPATFDDVPRVLSNSWGFNGGIDVCNNLLHSALDLAEAAGIAVVWSAGNEGPASGTMRNPANRADNAVSGFAVGGWDGVVDSVWVSSSRGPSPCSADMTLRIKPEIVAPSRDVRSTYLGTGYASSSGTSFSAPLAAGTLALMIEANPLLPPDSLLELLMFTAVDEGPAGLDNHSGYGRLDAYMACQAALTGLGWVRGHVQNQFGTPIAANIDVLDQPHHTVSDANGNFTFPYPAWLPCEIQVVASGHSPQSSSLSVSPQDTTYVTLTLQTTQEGILTGNVIDCRGLPASGAFLTILEQPSLQTTSDANGRFVMTLQPGQYSLACSSVVCGSVVVPQVQIQSGAVTDIEVVLPLNPAFLCSEPDNFGYFLCDNNDPGGPSETYSSVSPTTGGRGVIHNLADDGNVPLALPFPVTFYGNTYNRIFLNSNGIVSFVRYATAYNNLQLPYNLTPALFPFWDDFSDNLGGHILSDYNPAEGTYTLEWFEIPYFISIPPPTDSANFQLVIYDQSVVPTQSGNNVFEFRYGRIPRNGSTTIGIDRAQGNQYVRYGFNGTWEPHAVPAAEGVTVRVADEDISSGVPSMQIEPSALAIALEPGVSLDTSIFVHNNGSVPLAYYASASPMAATGDADEDTPPNAVEFDDPPKGSAPLRAESSDDALDEWIPDANGYAWRSSDNDTSVHYQFTSIANVGTNVGITWDDSTSYPRPLPFEFPFFDRVFKKYSVCSNGFITFWSQVRNYLNDPMVTARDPYYAIAAYWTDLNPSAGGQIWEYHDQINNRFIVQWNRIPPFGAPSSNTLTFQAILYPDGGIDLVYEHMYHPVQLKTVGIKGGRSSQTLQLSHNGSLVDSLMTLRIARPDTADASLRILSGSYAVVPPQGVQEIRLRFKNNSLSQGVMSLPLTIQSSDEDAGGTGVSFLLQGGTPFVPQTVIASQNGILSLHWVAHEANSYTIWTSLPNDTVFVPLVTSIADTHYTLGVPADAARAYAVTLNGGAPPRPGN